MRRIAWIISLCLIISGCGFTMRGHQASLTQFFPELSIAVDQRAIKKSLEQSLTAARVTVVPQNAPMLKVSDYHLDRTPLAYGVDGEIRRERLEAQVTVHLRDAKGQDWLGPKTLTARRDQYRYSAYDLANVSESDRMAHEIQRDLVNQVLQQLHWAGLHPIEDITE